MAEIWPHFELTSECLGVVVVAIGWKQGLNIFSSLYLIEDWDCYIPGDPISYTGTLAVGDNGGNCLFWTDPNVVNYLSYVTSNTVFPEADIATSANYCRNPCNSIRPWCAVTPSKSQLCDVPVCSPRGRCNDQGTCMINTFHIEIFGIWLSVTKWNACSQNYLLVQMVHVYVYRVFSCIDIHIPIYAEFTIGKDAKWVGIVYRMFPYVYL